MSEYAQGGLVPGPMMMRLDPGPAREGIGDDLTVIYADECFINRDGICARSDPNHANLPIPEDRWWSCPAHDDHPVKLPWRYRLRRVWRRY